jgi:hypothetical protein
MAKKIFGALADVAKNYAVTLDTLQKIAPGIERLKAENAAIRKYLDERERLWPALEQYRRDQDEMIKQIDRCRAELPSFAQHLYPRFSRQSHTNLWQSLDAKNPAKGFGRAGDYRNTWVWYDSWIAASGRNVKNRVIGTSEKVLSKESPFAYPVAAFLLLCERRLRGKRTLLVSLSLTILKTAGHPGRKPQSLRASGK